MQITKNLGLQHQTTYTQKVEKESGTFKDALAEKEKETVKYENLKVMGNGELYGLVNGNWQNTHANFNDRICGSNEILVIAEGFVQIGEELIRNGSLLGGVVRAPFTIQEDMGFSAMENSLALVPGKRVRLPDGTRLTWTRNGVNFVPRRTRNISEEAIAYKYASEIAFMMNEFTRVANKQALGVGRSIGIAKDKIQDIKTVLSAMGIDTNRDFYVNGKKFMFDTASGEFKYTLENSADGKYAIRYAKGPKLSLVR